MKGYIAGGEDGAVSVVLYLSKILMIGSRLGLQSRCAL
jgi:hypothetical protein